MPLTPTEQRESQARAAIENEKPSAPGGILTPVQERAKKIREKVAEKGSGEAIRSFVEPPLPSQDKREKSIDDKLGWERGADGKKVREPGFPAETIFNNAKTEDVPPSEIIEKGYESLGAVDKAATRNEAEKALRERIPDLADIILGPAGALVANRDRDDILDGILSDPKYRDTLRTTHMAKLDSDVIKTTEAQLENAKEASIETGRLDTEKGTDLTNLTTELTSTTTKLAEFDPGGTARVKLDKLIKDTPKIEAEIERLQPQIEHLQTQLGQLRDRETKVRGGMISGATPADLTAAQEEISTRETELKKALGDLHKQQAFIQERDNLTTEENRLKGEKTRLAREVKTATTDKNETTTKKLEAETAFQALKNQRGTEETAYLKGLHDSRKDAVATYVEVRLNEAQKVEAEVLSKEAADIVDSDKKKVLEGLSRRGLKENKKGHWEIDKSEAQKLGKEILAVGVDQYIEGWLKGSPPTTNPEELARIAEKMKDTAFINEMRGKVGPTLVARYLQSGGKFTEGDAAYLRGTEWGRDLIKNGIEEKKEVIKAIEGLKGEGAIDKSFFDRIKSVDNKTWLQILMLVLAGVALVGVFPVAGSIVNIVK